MKRIGYLITEEKITTEYCKSIILKASKHKVKRRSVKRTLDNIDLYAEKLRDMVLKETYK